MGYVFKTRYLQYAIDIPREPAYRTKLAETPDAWRWSSAWRRAHGSPQQRKLLSA
jgi:hypothetical protein